MDSTTMQPQDLQPTELRYFVDLPKFGPFHYTNADAIMFPWGLPGFSELRKFVILSVQENERYFWLQSLEQVEVAIPLVDPWSIFSDYQPLIPDTAQELLQIETAADFAILCVVTPEKGGTSSYVNLLAPVIINLHKMLGRQIMLEGSAYSIKTPVPLRSATDDSPLFQEDSV